MASPRHPASCEFLRPQTEAGRPDVPEVLQVFSIQEERPSLALKGTSWGTDMRPKGDFQQGLEVFLEEASRSVNTTGSDPGRRNREPQNLCPSSSP